MMKNETIKNILQEYNIESTLNIDSRICALVPLSNSGGAILEQIEIPDHAIINKNTLIAWVSMQEAVA